MNQYMKAGTKKTRREGEVSAPEWGNEEGKHVDAGDNEDDWEDQEEEVAPRVQCEDPFDDDYEQEDIILPPENEETGEETATGVETGLETAGRGPLAAGEEEKVAVSSSTAGRPKAKEIKDESLKPFMGSIRDVKPGETLEFDNHAYDMLHRAQTDWPCLSLDIIWPEQDMANPLKEFPHGMGNYPYTVYVVAGTQAAKQDKNEVYVMKWMDLHKTKHDDDSDDGVDDQPDDADEEPKLFFRSVGIRTCVNRIRSLNHTPIIAYQGENGQVVVMDMRDQFNDLLERNATNYKKEKPKQPKVLACFQKHCEGFGLAWNPHKYGFLASGGQDSIISLYSPDANMSGWVEHSQRIEAHTSSVEDLQFSPKEEHVLASCKARSCRFSVTLCRLR
jgi:ribosome assembly protein RRB1